MNKHIATTSDGTILKRNSQNRTYTHCIATYSEIMKWDHEKRDFVGTGTYHWKARSWVGRPELVESRKAQWSHFDKVVVLEAERV